MCPSRFEPANCKELLGLLSKLRLINDHRCPRLILVCRQAVAMCLVIGLAVKSAAAAGSRPLRFAVFGIQTGAGTSHPVVLFYEGRQRRISTQCTALGNFVTTWGAVAAIERGGVVGLTASGRREVIAPSLGPCEAFAVSNNGLQLAENLGYADGVFTRQAQDGLIVKSIRDHQEVIHFTAEDLKKLGLQVTRARIDDANVVFSPSGSDVYFAAPSAGVLDASGSRPSCTVKCPLKGGTPAVVARGAPIGFCGTKLVTWDSFTSTLRCAGHLRAKPWALVSTCGKMIWVLEQGVDYAMITGYTAELRRTAERFKIRSIRRGFYVRQFVVIP